MKASSAQSGENGHAKSTRSFRRYVSSDTAILEKQLSVEPDAEDPAQLPATPLTVAVAVRRGRLLLLTIAVIVFVVGPIVVLAFGVDFRGIHAGSESDLRELLDKYNSYSGNIASLFGKPLELVITMVAQEVSLRFLAQAYTQPRVSWQQLGARIAISGAIGYLISNGINAINVQLYEQEIHPIIDKTDLFMTSTFSDTITNGTTVVAKTISENTPGNLSSNTVLRNAVLPRVPLNQSYCDWELTRLEVATRGRTQLPTIEYGFTQRDWQSRLLQRALPAQTFRMVVNPTNKTANAGRQSADLPMDVSLAADLFLYMMTVAPNVFPIGKAKA